MCRGVEDEEEKGTLLYSLLMSKGENGRGWVQ